jgi:hypothetical protein
VNQDLRGLCHGQLIEPSQSFLQKIQILPPHVYREKVCPLEDLIQGSERLNLYLVGEMLRAAVAYQYDRCILSQRGCHQSLEARWRAIQGDQANFARGRSQAETAPQRTP